MKQKLNSESIRIDTARCLLVGRVTSFSEVDGADHSPATKDLFLKNSVVVLVERIKDKNGESVRAEEEHVGKDDVNWMVIVDVHSKQFQDGCR